MKKVIWIVMKGESEIIRVATKKLATMIADEVGGYVHRYCKEQ